MTLGVSKMQKLIKKMKKHERDILLPLYEKHAKYLLRVIKTLNEKDTTFNVKTWIRQIPVFIRVATCHEVAINQYSGVEIETHQNPLGLERQYTSNPKAKNISRNLRVRIIWKIIERELEKDFMLSDYKIYDSLMINSNKTQYLCPFCENVFAERIMIVLGHHADGTEEFRYEYETYSQCEHYVLTNFPEDTEYGDIDIDTLDTKISDYGGDFTEIIGG